MSVYLDASLVVALFINDLSTERAKAAMRRDWPAVIVSDFAAAEFASAIARRVRMELLTLEEARGIFIAFDQWMGRAAQRVAIDSTDLLTATGFLRRLDLNLRAPDAINIAVSRRVGAQLATFDDRMGFSASVLGLELAGAAETPCQPCQCAVYPL